jgi:hypothetical protein
MFGRSKIPMVISAVYLDYMLYFKIAGHIGCEIAQISGRREVNSHQIWGENNMKILNKTMLPPSK